MIWVTGSPFPCVSLYKPLVFEGLGVTPFADINTALGYAEEAADFSRRALALDETNRVRIRERAEHYEKRFEEMLRSSKDMPGTCATCMELEKEFRREALG